MSIRCGAAPRSQKLADFPHADSARSGDRGAVRDLPARGRARGRGFIDRITIVPLGAAPQFSAIVSDAESLGDSPEGERRGPPARYQGSRVKLVWLGQRRIPGVEAGTQLAFEGMVSPVDGFPTIFNPRYEIIGRPEADHQ